MDPESERAWLKFAQAEQAYIEALADLRHFDMEPMLREGLLNLQWRRQALGILRSSDVKLCEKLLPELFELATVGHSLIAAVRRCIRRIPRERLVVQLVPLVQQLTEDPNSDYEAYRRIAELLREIECWPLLGVLVRAASTSSDVDILEVAEDFGELDGRDNAQ